ncbi:hypothetical protein [Acetobacter pasteurianus]|uniref:hypothetical protein n=1 Tax=Acetobacter pasteurianus TaxID=438 RepID=UPI001362DA8B|nr:hypothetical protein [Acetobacter pasteurianus]QHM90577.1 hypothetical protein FCN51_02930 [Acetobacter pasteurianus]
MSHPEKAADISVQQSSKSSRGCFKKIALAVGLCVAVGTTLVVQHSKAYGIMARIHHGLIVCTPGTGLVTTPVSTSSPHDGVPSMLRLELANGPDGRVMVEPGSNELEGVLASAHHSNTLLMLDINSASADNVVKLVRKTRMRDRVILVPPDHKDTETVLHADSKIMVAIPVNSERDAYAAHKLAGRHPYAAYLSPSATPHLFALTHRDAEAIITDNPGAPKGSTSEFLAERPVDIMITQQPTQLADTTTNKS